MSDARIGPRRRPAGSLTGRGWAVVGAGGTSLLVGHLVGVQELYGVGAGALVAVAGALAWIRAAGWSVAVDRRLSPTRVSAGERPRVELTVRNTGARTSPVLTLRDPFDGGGPTAELMVAQLEPGRSESARYHLPGSPRGVFGIGPLTLEAADPFGLARRSLVAVGAEQLVVHPAVERLRFPVVADGSDRRDGGAIPRRGADNDEFAGLREYRPGDDLRRVHWASSARSETLLVKELQGEHRGRVVVVVDLRRSVWSGPTLEAAMGAAATVVDDALASHLQVRLLTTGGVDTGIGSGARHRARLLDELAVAEAHAGDHIRLGEPESTDAGTTVARNQGTGRLVGTDRTIVITSDRTGPGDLRLIQSLAHRSPVTLVVMEQVARGSRARREHAASSLPGRVVRVSPTESFASAWDEAAVSP